VESPDFSEISSPFFLAVYSRVTAEGEVVGARKSHSFPGPRRAAKIADPFKRLVLRYISFSAIGMGLALEDTAVRREVGKKVSDPVRLEDPREGKELPPHSSNDRRVEGYGTPLLFLSS